MDNFLQEGCPVRSFFPAKIDILNCVLPFSRLISGSCVAFAATDSIKCGIFRKYLLFAAAGCAMSFNLISIPYFECVYGA